MDLTGRYGLPGHRDRRAAAAEQAENRAAAGNGGGVHSIIGGASAAEGGVEIPGKDRARREGRDAAANLGNRRRSSLVLNIAIELGIRIGTIHALGRGPSASRATSEKADRSTG